MNDAQINQILDRAKSRLIDEFSPKAIYLYGSYAYGTPHEGSDIDVLVVVEQSDETFFKRSARAYRALRGLGVPLDVQVYTEDEFESRAALPVSFERTVKTKGVTLRTSHDDSTVRTKATQ